MTARIADAPMPRRVRLLATRLRDIALDEYDRAFKRLWADIDRRLMHDADRAHTAAQTPFFEARRVFQAGAAGVDARFAARIEAALAALRPWRPATSAATPATGMIDTLALVDHDDMHESTVLQAIASRHAARASLGLHLLGQRMAVLACAPAMDADTLPLGPQMLCEAFADALRPLPLEPEMRQRAYRSFDGSAMASYAGFVETVNTLLDREDVLPGLAYVPLRVRPTVQGGGDADATPTAPAPQPRGATQATAPRGPAAAPFDGWRAPESAQAADADGFDALRHLLAGHRHTHPAAHPPAPAALSTGTLSTGEVLEELSRLPAVDRTQPMPAPGQRLHGLRDTLLAQAREATGTQATLAAEDSDTFELLGLLFAEIGRELRSGGPGQALLAALEVPMAKLALQDRAFFAQEAHPARRLLNSVAEAHAACLDDEPDAQTRACLDDAVEELAADPKGAANAFDRANQRLEAHLQTLARKAELAERRQVEAARGKEKLALAKRAAAAVITRAAGVQPLPRFVRTLLEQTWQDVLTLSWLRHGEDSSHWHNRVATTAEIVALHAPGAGPAAVDLQARIEEALELVGHAPAQAESVARRLVSGVDLAAAGDPDALPLAARPPEDDADAQRAALPARTEAEDASYRHLRSLPYGTWFDFVTNQQGDIARRRMSWYSVVTGNALFVNARGQRAAEYTLDALARLMACGQARVVTVTRARLVDRAWQAAVDTLRGTPRADAGATP